MVGALACKWIYRLSLGEIKYFDHTSRIYWRYERMTFPEWYFFSVAVWSWQTGDNIVSGRCWHWGVVIKSPSPLIAYTKDSRIVPGRVDDLLRMRTTKLTALGLRQPDYGRIVGLFTLVKTRTRCPWVLSFVVFMAQHLMSYVRRALKMHVDVGIHVTCNSFTTEHPVIINLYSIFPIGAAERLVN